MLFSGGVKGGDRAVNMPANQRGLGMVFQSYAIWPHMTVFDNVAFPLQVRKRADRPSKKEIADRVERVLATMELSPQAGRQATKLSGGQQQRLALARALVIQPPLLLLDEPLSNLDAKLRESLRYELKRLQRELGITSVYVTHDQVEALALSTHIAVMQAGSVVQLGKPREIYESPSNKFVAEFIGTSNFIPGTVGSAQGGAALASTPPTAGWSSSPGPTLPVGLGRRRLDPSRGGRALDRRAARARWPTSGTARSWRAPSSATPSTTSSPVGKHEIRARVNPSVSIEPGTQVYLQLDPTKISLVPVG